jgi:hypothetical protein
MSSQAEALLQIIGFFQVKEAMHAARAKAIHVPALPVARAVAQQPVAERPALPHPVLKSKATEVGSGGFQRF